MITQSFRFGIAALALIAMSGALLLGIPSFQSNSIPAEITDPEFWRIISDFSEPDGTFRYENFVSNEASVQNVIPALRQLTRPGGVYLGVAPEQNFTYIFALKSKIAFIMDIRRQNMLELLIYKTVFEMSPSRADFVARLFSRKRPAGLDDKTTAKALFAAYETAPKDDFAQNLVALKATMAKHAYGLSSDDQSAIDYVYQVFYRGGPSMNYEFASASPGAITVNYGQIMAQTDPDGNVWTLLGTEDAYQYVREMERKNLIIPLVADFSGPKTIRRISEYLKEHNANVGAFYVSNVEQYLDGSKLRNFQDNVATLPLDSSSTFIRWVPSPFTPSLPSWYTPGMGSVMTTLQPMMELTDQLKSGRAPATWPDVVKGIKDPDALVRAIQDPSLRTVAGRVSGVTGLKPNELLTVELVENLRGSGLILRAEVLADGSFEFHNVQPRTYQAIVLKTCKNCQESRGLGSPLNIAVGDKDIIGLQLRVN